MLNIIRNDTHLAPQSVCVVPYRESAHIELRFGALYALLRPHEARALADALLEAADAAQAVPVQAVPA